MTDAEMKALIDEFLDLLLAWLDANYFLIDDGTTNTNPYRLELRWRR